ncbi:MAG: ferrous iron transport protein A [Merismopedia sp. SIO2A8]|nr:ferrous iron transport protein A [Symploca sp. SIO2B6]NET53001.1 ferrous iron transport protein A [Merismopedia sp. SIO2A8]
MNDKDSQNHRQQRRHQRQGWGFTFFGETPEIRQKQENISEITQESLSVEQQLNPVSTNGASFPLAMASMGDRLQIVKLTAKEGAARRLLSMGLNPGVEVQVISKTATSSVIVAIQDNRIGLGAGMAHKVIVTPKN